MTTKKPKSLKKPGTKPCIILREFEIVCAFHDEKLNGENYAPVADEVETFSCVHDVNQVEVFGKETETNDLSLKNAIADRVSHHLYGLMQAGEYQSITIRESEDDGKELPLMRGLAMLADEKIGLSADDEGPHEGCSEFQGSIEAAVEEKIISDIARRYGVDEQELDRELKAYYYECQYEDMENQHEAQN